MLLDRHKDVLKIGFAFSVVFPGLVHRPFPLSSGERWSGYHVVSYGEGRFSVCRWALVAIARDPAVCPVFLDDSDPVVDFFPCWDEPLTVGEFFCLLGTFGRFLILKC